MQRSAVRQARMLEFCSEIGRIRYRKTGRVGGEMVGMARDVSSEKSHSGKYTTDSTIWMDHQLNSNNPPPIERVVFPGARRQWVSWEGEPRVKKRVLKGSISNRGEMKTERKIAASFGCAKREICKQGSRPGDKYSDKSSNLFL